MVVGGKKRPKAVFPPTFHHHGEKAGESSRSRTTHGFYQQAKLTGRQRPGRWRQVDPLSGV